MFRRVLVFVMALFLGQSLYAQYSISGTVKEQQAQTPLGSASVRLRSTSDSTFARSILSDSAGRFRFQNLPADSFILSISFSGFQAITKGIRLDSTNVTLDTAGAGGVEISIAMVPSTSTDLATVVISTTIAPATQRADTLQINANQYKVNPDASTEDLVRKMPGITIENGQVKAQGENVQKVTIDGRELFGDDATAALRNLPAEVVDKIQVFDRLSDQAQFSGVDDGNTTKGINIVTKANMRNGQFGRVFAGYGTDGRYAAGGNTTLLKDNRRISIVGNFNNTNQQNFSQQDLLGVTSSGGGGGRGNFGGGGGRPQGGGGGRPQGGGNFGGGGNAGNFLVGQQNGINRTNAFGINYSDIWNKNITVTGSYFFNDTKNNTNQISNLRYLNQAVSDIDQISDSTTSTSRNTNHRFNLRFEWRIDSNNQLTITPNVSIQNNTSYRRTGSNSRYFTNPDSLLSVINENISNSQRSGNNLNNSIFYRHAFAKRGRTFSINLNTSYNKRDGETYVQTFAREYLTSSFDDTTSNRFTDQYNNGLNLSANISYSEPLGQNSQLQVSYSPSVSKSKSDQQAYNQNSQDGKYSIFLSNFSNVFETRTDAQNAGLSYRWGNRDRQISFGVNYQYTNLNSERLFPIKAVVDKSFTNVLPNAQIRYKVSTRSSFRINYRTNVNQPSVTQLQDVLDPTGAPSYSIGNPNLNQQYSHQLGTQYTYTNTGKGIVLVGNIFYQAATNYIANASFNSSRDTVVSGEVLRRGYRLNKPVNLDGYGSFRSFVTLAVPLRFIKSNLNLNGGISLSTLPGMTNYILNETKSTTYTLGSVIGSNVSQYVDFTISYSANFNDVKSNAVNSVPNTYFQHVAGVQLNLLSKQGWFFQNDLNNQYYSGLSEGFNQSYFLWNMSAGRKFLKGQKGELRASVFDLLKQNRSISRNITENYIEDVRNDVLQQYFMLTFSYNLRNFGTAAARQQNREGRGNLGDGPPRF
ncbi:MAG TPA: TonB-dependent receptor [Flavisolibacter sp.]